MEDDFFSSDSCYQSVDDSFDSPNVKIGCRDSCCNVVKSVNVLTKSEENENLLIKLIGQIENPELQKEYLDKFKKNLFFKDSILGMITASLYDGPVYFNCYPDITLALDDPNIVKALTLNIADRKSVV